jgi:hypothetical protein
MEPVETAEEITERHRTVPRHGSRSQEKAAEAAKLHPETATSIV